MEVDARDVDPELARLRDDAQRALRRQAELRLVVRRLDRAVRDRLDAGRQADERAPHARGRGAGRLVLGVEHDRDAGLGGCAQLVVGLVVAVEEDPLAPGCPASSANASSPSVETSAPTPSSASTSQERDVRERLRPVDDERIRRGLAVRAGLGADRLLAVDDERRPVLLREAVRGDAAEVELGDRRRGRNRGKAKAQVASIKVAMQELLI